MSLIAHWPLDGRLEDISGNGYDLKMLGTPLLKTDGPIGKCYQFNGSTNIAQAPSKFTDTILEQVTGGNYSIAFWVRMDEVSGSSGGLCGFVKPGPLEYNRMMDIFAYPTANDIHFSMNAINSVNDEDMFIRSFIVEDVFEHNKWIHVTCNIGDSWVEMFINGISVNRSVDLVERYYFKNPDNSLFTIGGNDFQSSSLKSMSDVRVYDNILSVDEIQSIMKPTLIDLKMNNNEEYRVSIVDDIYDNLESWKIPSQEASIKLSQAFIGGKKCIKVDKIREAGGDWFGILSNFKDRQTPHVGEDITFSCEVYLDRHVTQNVRFYLPERKINNDLMNHNVIVPITTTTKPGEWISVSNTFTSQATTPDSSYLEYMRIDWHWLETIPGECFYIRNIAVYRNAPKNVEYHKEPCDGTVSDSSGYGNHGTINMASPPRFITEPKCGYSIQSKTFETMESIKLTGIESFDFNRDFTLHISFKLSELTQWTRIFSLRRNRDGGANELTLSIAGYINFTVNTSGELIRLRAVDVAEIDIIYNITIINSNKHMSIYSDGILKATVDFTGSEIPIDERDYLRLGTRDYNPPAKFNGEIYDFKFIAGALPIETVIEKFIEPRASIYSNGDFETNVLNDKSTDNLISIDKEFSNSRISIENISDTSFVGKCFIDDGYSDYINFTDTIKPGESIVIEFTSVISWFVDREENTQPADLEFFIFDTADYSYYPLSIQCHHTKAEGLVKKHRQILSIPNDRTYVMWRFDINYRGSIFLIKDFRVSKHTENVKMINDKKESVVEVIETNRMNNTNLVDYGVWKPSENSVYIADFRANSGFEGDDKRRIIIKNPWGEADLVWACEYNRGIGGPCGGFVISHKMQHILRTTNIYRYSIWMKRKDVAVARCHFGPVGMNLYEMDGVTPNTNPYFISTTPGNTGINELEDEWLFMVYYIYPNDHKDSNLQYGLYNKEGRRITVNNENGIEQDINFKFPPIDSDMVGDLCAYLYYTDHPTEKAYFYRPRIDLIDGTEPSVDDLLSGSEHGSMMNAIGDFNPLFPNDEQFFEIKRFDGARWGKIFYHNNHSGTVLFSKNNKSEFMRCNTDDKKSIIYLSSAMRGLDNKYEFLLEYDSFEGYARWKQDRPLTYDRSSELRYEEIANTFETNGAVLGGLSYYNVGDTAFLAANNSAWYFAIGAVSSWVGNAQDTGIPGPTYAGRAEQAGVHLWVRLPEVSFIKDNKLFCNEVTEI